MAPTATSAVVTPTQTNGQLPAPPRRPFFSRVRGNLAVAVVFAVLAGLFNLLAVGGRSGTPVAVASRDLRAGETFDAGAVRFLDVSGSKAFIATLLRPADVAAMGGFVLTHSLTSGSPVSRDDVAASAAPSQQRSMSIPVPEEKAVGGTVRVGDHVDVIDGGGNGIDPSYVVTDVEVLGVSKGSDSLSSTSHNSFVTVAVPDGGAALRLAGAIERNKVQILRSTGATPLSSAVASASPTTTRPGAR